MVSLFDGEANQYHTGTLEDSHLKLGVCAKLTREDRSDAARVPGSQQCYLEPRMEPRRCCTGMFAYLG